ncbi:IucA/IucC family protein (plasmid) [Agrobacterium tumefaciens]|uniref:IucA/IucC family protein n=1 Tax=Agrobacterium tumefaciens TaxID=358 RepID=UPI001574E211|nr:IucA/IucC family protein [Agrobacterium tumefaciens]WCK74413.1 IucA/IucC family protein [Agrobacterium tumefaciens]
MTIQFQTKPTGETDRPSLSALPAAGSRVASQTLSAFLTEHLLPASSILDAPLPGQTGEISLQAADPSITYRAVVKRTRAYDRWLVQEDSIWRWYKLDSARCDDPLCMLDDLLPLVIGDTTTQERFREEIRQTFLNHAEALVISQNRDSSLAQLGYDMTEAYLTDGHRYHPCFKSRVGFTPRENRAYGPEFANPIKPVWLGVHKDLASSSSIAASGGQDRLLLTSAEAPLPESDFHILPVHPWQWEREIEAATVLERAAGRIVLLGEAKHGYLAQQSIRTLADQTSPEAPTLKLALSIRNTSTARTLAAHTVLNAPIISAWLNDIARSDPYLGASGTIFLLERMGTTVTLPPTQDRAGNMRGAMAAIWRDPVHKYLRVETERASPFSILTHLDGNGRPSIGKWLEAFGVVNWTQQLLRVAAIPVVHLLIAHGVALESHQQNMVLIHQNGWPLRVALKDFHDGVRFIPGLLRGQAPGLVATPLEHARVNPNSYVEASDPEDVRDFMFDALFGVNLAELAFFLERHFGFDERSFWRIAAGGIQEHLDMDETARKGAVTFGLMNNHVVVEDLARRRLEIGPVPARRVPNPLVDALDFRGENNR